MRVPKLFLLLLALGATAVYFIMSCIGTEVKMLQALDSAEKKTKDSWTADKVTPESDASSDVYHTPESDSKTETESPTAEESEVSPSESAASSTDTSDAPTTSALDTSDSSANSQPDDTYSKLISPAIKIKNGMRPRLDVAFCIDTTASMQGEIDTVKAKVKSMVTKISQSSRRPIVRVGLVAYRDDGDNYVTKVFQFSDNIDAVVRAISELNADGGGDRPEAVDRGLHAAIHNLQWNNGNKTAKLLFLIGDAPPHSDHSMYDCKREAEVAIANGIRINTIGCEGLDSDNGIEVFKQIALVTNGNFEPLSYHQQIVDTNGKAATLITSGGKSYVMNSTDKEAWKSDIGTLVAKGEAAPALQGATNGTIGVQGSDATYVTGVNTAGAVRADNNLDAMMLKGAESAMSVFGK